MKRLKCSARPNWQQIVESQGLPYHSAGGVYWQDDVYYEFNEREEAYINNVTEIAYSRIHDTVSSMMANHADKEKIRRHMVDSGMSHKTVDAIFENWFEVGRYKTRTSYGRFDLGFDKNMRLRMFEYNADTPFVLIETAYCQWEWLVDKFGDKVGDSIGQINELYPELKEMFISWHNQGVRDMVFTCDKGQVGEVFEYEASCLYLQEIASEVGMNTKFRFVSDLQVGYDKPIITVDGSVPDAIFKLYPTEWLVDDLAHAGQQNAEDALRLNNFIEEPFKLLMGGKWLLPYLHQRYGLLDDIFIPAWHDRNACLSERVVAKSYYGRIGTEVEVLEPYQQTTLKGPVVYQKFVESAVFDGFLPVLCSWVINGRSAGVGIREQTTLITSDSCRFACHLVNYG